MPFNSELGMRTFDPLAAYESGQPAAHVAAVAFERGQSQADKARQILKRNMAVEAMKIRAQELYSHMEQTPENQNLAQRQAFLENAPGIFGEERGMGDQISSLLKSDEANLVREKANRALQDYHEQTLDLRRQVETGKAESRGLQQEINLYKAVQGVEDRTAQRELKEKQQELTGRSLDIREKQLGAREENIARLAGRYSLSQADVMELKSLYTRRDKLQETYDELPDTVWGITGSKPNPKKLKAKLDLDGLNAQIKTLDETAKKRSEAVKAKVSGESKSQEPSSESKPIPQDQLKIGTKYRLDNGRIGTYKGGDPESESSYAFEDEGGSG